MALKDTSSLDAILDSARFHEPEKRGEETTLSIWVPVELKERHRRLPFRVRQKIASVLREIAGAVIDKAEKQAS